MEGYLDIASDALAFRGGPALRASAQPRGEAEIRKAAEEFEALFVSQLTSYMFAGLESDGPFGAGPGESIYRNMLSEEFGKAAARAGGFGIADAVYRELMNAQEALGS